MNNNEIEDFNKPERKHHIELWVVAIFFCILFALMIHNLTSFMVNESEEFIYNPFNSRFSTFSDKIVRGNIESDDGTIIAETLEKDGKEYRNYPYAEMFSHVVGYVSEGMSGLEEDYSFDLLRSHISMDQLIENDLNGTKSMGDTMITTLDFDTQKAAYDAMGYYKGAVVAIEPDTGKIVAMVSKPDFNPNTLEEYWSFITDETNDSSILLNRASQGLYPPGSTFKLVTTLAYLKENNDASDFSYNCRGSEKFDNYTIHCSSNEVHGSLNLEKAFAESCNCAYATMGTSIDGNSFLKTAETLLFNTDIPSDISNLKQSRFDVDSTTAKELVAQTSIGQGNTLVTPLHMALITAAVANDGLAMKPYIVAGFKDAEGNAVKVNTPEEIGNIMSKEEASIISDYMSAVTEYGTARKIDFGDLTVYGKTGTAQFSEDLTAVHSWFISYAVNSEGKKLAVAVIMENAGYGSKYAAPLTAEVYKAYFD